MRLLPEDVDALIAGFPVTNSDDNLFVELRTPWLLYADQFAEPGAGPMDRTWAAIDSFGPASARLLESAPAGMVRPRVGELALSHLAVRHDDAASAALAEIAGEAGEAVAARQLLAPGGDPAEYAAALDRALELEPESFPVRAIRARARLRQGELESALADTDAALALRPDDPATLALRASILLRSGRADEALVALDQVRATEYWQMQPTLWLLAGQVELALLRFEESRASLERYAESEPGLALVWQLLEQVYLALELDPFALRARRNIAVNLYMVGLDAERSGDLERARDALRRSLEVAPDYAPAKQALARLSGG